MLSRFVIERSVNLNISENVITSCPISISPSKSYRDTSRCIPYLCDSKSYTLPTNKNCYSEMVRNNVSLTVELVFVDGDEGCNQRVSICFLVLSKSEGLY